VRECPAADQNKEETGKKRPSGRMNPAHDTRTPRRTRRVALRGVAGARNQQVWDAVVREFAAMGASRAQARQAARRLRLDPAFHHEWASSMPEWCPGLAHYEPCGESE